MTTLLDAAFCLVSHSITTQQAQLQSHRTIENRLSELTQQFPQVDTQVIQEAYARAEQLEDTAIEMAEMSRGRQSDPATTVLDVQSLAERCPGFSDESYFWAVNDGYILTRK